jgi:uncharacterized protein YaiI (UPF0178 family)
MPGRVRAGHSSNWLKKASRMSEIYVDGDACPVKVEIVRVADRHGLVVHMVSNAYMRLPESPLVRRVVVSDGFDAADDWIAERVGARDIVITADIPLAARCLVSGADVIGPSGRPFDHHNIGNALAMRELKSHLRDTGEIRDHAASFSKQDRSRFLQKMEEAIQVIKRRPPG